MTISVNNKNYKYEVHSNKLYTGETIQRYSTTLDNTTYVCNSLEDLKEKILTHKPYTNAGAASWYGQGRYMGD